MSTLSRLAGRNLVRSAVIVLALGAVLAADDAVAQDADHLILSEVVTTANRFGAEFVEIVNPTGAAVPMQGVHLTNATNAANGTGYWRLADSAPTSLTAGGGTGGTFHGRFPDGYELAAGDTLVVSVSGSGEYQSAYGRLPDFEVYEDGLTPDAVPELVEVFPGSIGAGTIVGGTNPVALGDNAGSLVIYLWDGTTDLVADLDYAHWGSNQSFRVDKTGVTVGAGSYLADTGAGSQITLPGSAGDGRSFMRNDAGEGSEATPGNGLTGHDETSEDLGATWAVASSQDPPAAPASWHPAAPLVTAPVVSPAAPYDGQPATVTLTILSPSTVSAVDIVYTVDGGAPVTLTAANSGDDWSAEIPAQAEDAVVAWYATVANADGATATHPAAAPRFTAGWTVAEAPVAGEGPAKLLLSEVCTLGSSQEFVEVYNPNDFDVDMSDYYLTDAIYSPNNTGYWNLGGGVLNADTVGGGAFTDFHARFPDGFTIGAGDTIVVTIPGSSSFVESYGFVPHLELYEDDALPDAVPDMRWIFGSEGNNSIISADSTPSLTNGGEPVILYHHEDGDDLVTDVDIFIWGAGGSYQFDKTGKTVGASTYAADTATGQQDLYAAQLEFGNAYARIDANEGTQSPTGSNGIDGRDETSENWSVTFDMLEADPARPGGSGPGTGEGAVELKVPAATFIPAMGEIFPVEIISKRASETRVRILDLEGRVVVTLFDSRFDGNPSTLPGVYTAIPWDGRDQYYERVSGGMYVVHLSVVETATGDEETRTAPVVVTTRLSN